VKVQTSLRLGSVTNRHPGRSQIVSFGNIGDDWARPGAENSRSLRFNGVEPRIQFGF